MAFTSTSNDLPLQIYENCSLRQRRCSRPLVCSILNSLEDQMDQKVGQVFRRLPAVMLELEDEFGNNGLGKKRKLRSGAASEYEPTSKVVMTNKDDKFKICMDMSNYQPDEITVKVANNKLNISAKHEAKGKDVYEFYEIYRSFDLPENVDPNSVTSRFGVNGELTVEAPVKELLESNARSIPIDIEGREQQCLEAPKSPSKEKNSTQ